jgi:hypothetical protein
LGHQVQPVTAMELPDERKASVLEAYLAASRRRTTRQLLAGATTRARDHPVFQLHDNP